MGADVDSTCLCLCGQPDNATLTRGFMLPCDTEKCADRCLADPRGCANGTVLDSVHTCGYTCASFNVSAQAEACRAGVNTTTSVCGRLDRAFKCATALKCSIDSNFASICSTKCVGVAGAACSAANSCTKQASCEACQSFSTSCLWCDYKSAGGHCYDTNECPAVNAAPTASSSKPNQFTCGGVALAATMTMTNVAVMQILFAF